MLGLAFIIPAYKIFDDIKSRFGEEPLLCPSPSFIQPYSAPNDGKVAERPLLDIIKGNDTGTMILLHGLPRVNNTITDEAIGFQGCRFVYPNGCSHLGWKTTDLKKIAEMMRKHCHIGAADWTRLERLAQYLRIKFQEVPDGRTAFFQGDLSDQSSIMTGTFNEFMLATLIDTAFSAQPPLFASSVTIIGAYNYIDCNYETHHDAAAVEIHNYLDCKRETTNDAAAAEISDRIINEILVWIYSQ